MRKTTIRKFGLKTCMLLTLSLGALSSAGEALAQQLSCSVMNGIRTCVDPSTQQIVSITAANPITPEQLASNPAILLENPATLGANVTNLMQAGVSPAQLSEILAAAGGANGMTAQQWASVLGNLQSAGNIAGTAGLVNGLFGGYIDPQLAQILSGVGGVNNIQGITGILNSTAIQNALQNLTPAQAGPVLDQILQSALGNLDPAALQNLTNPANLQALINSISQAVPGLEDLLGPGGIEQALLGSLGNLTDPLSGGLGGLLDGFGSALGLNAVGTCACSTCRIQIPRHHTRIRTQITTQFTTLQDWMVRDFFQGNVLPALMLMANQLTVAGMQQVQTIGMFLDAKHQLETQRLFQELTARAHKDYHPSEGMCTFGTTVRSLAMSDRKSDMAQSVLASRMMQRQTLNGEGIAWQGNISDIDSRLGTYRSVYCDPADNQNGLTTLCQTTAETRYNMDVDFTRGIESKLTLDLEFTDLGGAAARTTVTPDEQDVFALSANLYSHKVAPDFPGEKFGDGPTNMVRSSAAERYMDLRSIFAKRSVAQNSFAALVGMRARGDAESAPYVKAVIRELGVSDDQTINELLGEDPSYFAQMEVLTKKLYQNPAFYTELYDKPVNVERKGAALQAIGLMQDRDLYNSLLRSEAILSVLLEQTLQTEQNKITNQRGHISAGGGR